jgi:hypothetical protein
MTVGDALKSITQKHSILLIVSALAIFGCSKVQMSASDASANNSLGFSEPPDTDAVRTACENSPHKQLKQSYLFEKPSYTCKWEQDGNLAKNDQYFQARIEEDKTLQLEPGAIICDVKLDFAEQSFLYDDHFLFAFDNSVIASSYDFSGKLKRQYSMLQYDWSRIAGMYWDENKEGVFCAEDGRCAWPDTDTQGSIDMNYSSDFVKHLMAVDINRTKHILKFVSIGDNDDHDCEHSDVNFDLTVDYVVPK